MKRKPTGELQKLSAASQKLFAVLTKEYSIGDAGGREVLLSGLRSKDLAEQAEAQIEADGRMLLDRFQQGRAHPLLPIARDYRAQWTAALRQLNLAVGEPPKIGRPERS